MTQVKTYYFTEGNTVRVEAQPLPDRKQREQERKEEQQRKRRMQQRRHARMMRQQRLMAMFTAVTVLAACGLFVGYVNLTNSITTHMDNISQLQEEISDLKADNSATASRIATAANLSDVKNAAINQLGMVYANADQIVYYDMESADYMSQYQNIP
jgi:cell division protein FtsL